MLWLQRRSMVAHEAGTLFLISALAGFDLGPCSLMAANVTTGLSRNPRLRNKYPLINLDVGLLFFPISTHAVGYITVIVLNSRHASMHSCSRLSLIDEKTLASRIQQIVNAFYEKNTKNL